MPTLEDVKKIAEKVTGWSRPKPGAIEAIRTNARPGRGMTLTFLYGPAFAEGRSPFHRGKA
jgi:hypothetical protein